MRLICVLFSALIYLSLPPLSHAEERQGWRLDETGLVTRFSQVVFENEVRRNKIIPQLQRATYYEIEESEVADFIVQFNFFCSNVACSTFVIKNNRVIHELNSYGLPLEIDTSQNQLSFNVVDSINEDGFERLETLKFTIKNDSISYHRTNDSPNILWWRHLETQQN